MLRSILRSLRSIRWLGVLSVSGIAVSLPTSIAVLWLRSSMLWPFPEPLLGSVFLASQIVMVVSGQTLRIAINRAKAGPGNEPTPAAPPATHTPIR